MSNSEAPKHLSRVRTQPTTARADHDNWYRGCRVYAPLLLSLCCSLLTLSRLNLATANRVFIVEPQWNPSVENQAIARALRLGQEQRVQVTRYVVNRTVEQVCTMLQLR